MKIAIAIDSFKGSLSSIEAGNAVKEGIQKADPTADVSVYPLADGGEGTVTSLTQGLGGQLHTITVSGPLSDPVEAIYGITSDAATGELIAIMEMSQAAGITLIPPAKRNPLETTSFGVGEMIRDAIEKGCRKFVIGIGGSATNDGGVGMLQALGYDFLESPDEPIDFGAFGLSRLNHISAEHVIPELKDCKFYIACDVQNPLCGPNGASAVFGPQKGANPDMVRAMDLWLSNYANLTKQFCIANGALGNPTTLADASFPGTGAAGGMGFAFLTYTNATLQSGVELIMEQTHFADHLTDVDLVITGEGCLDGQTAMGKAPIGVAKLAKEHGIPVIAFSGIVKPEAKRCNSHGIDAFFPILRNICTSEEAMDARNAAQNLADTAEQVYRALNLFQ